MQPPIINRISLTMEQKSQLSVTSGLLLGLALFLALVLADSLDNASSSDVITNGTVIDSDASDAVELSEGATDEEATGIESMPAITDEYNELYSATLAEYNENVDYDLRTFTSEDAKRWGLQLDGKMTSGVAYLSKELKRGERIPVIVLLEEPTKAKRKSFEDASKIFLDSQSDVLSELSSREFNLKSQFRSINAFAGDVSEDGLEELISDDNVIRIYYDEQHEVPEPESNVPQMSISTGAIGANESWAMGCNGTGIDVGVIDTGIDYTHPDLGGCSVVNWVAGTCRVKVVGGYDFGDGDTNPKPNSDAYPYSHGTHVAGTVAANGTVVGVAPRANLYALKVIDASAHLYDSYIISAVDWAIAHDLDVMTMSIGGTTYSLNDGVGATELVFDYAIDSGLVVTLSAGNSGDGTGTIGTPTAAAKVITVGASDDHSTTSPSDDTIASFSSRGPSAFGRLDPDVVAPGVEIYSTIPGGTYDSWGGTSMATPHVAGAAALMLSCDAGLSPTEIRARLMHTATNITGHVFDKGPGLINVSKAMTYNLTASINDGKDRWEELVLPGMNATTDLELTNELGSSVNISFSIESITDHEGGLALDAGDFTLPANATLADGWNMVFDLEFAAPVSADPGIYGTTLIISANGNPVLRVPIVISIPLYGSGTITGTVNDECYYQDYCDDSNWGDWVYYPIYAYNGTALGARLNWTSSDNDLDLLLYAPNGYLVDSDMDFPTSDANVSLASSASNTYWMGIHAWTIDSSPLTYDLTVTFISNMSVTPAYWQGDVSEGASEEISFTVQNDANAKEDLDLTVNILQDGDDDFLQDSADSGDNVVWRWSTDGAALDLSNAKYLNATLTWDDSDDDLDLVIVYYEDGEWIYRESSEHDNPTLTRAYENIIGDIQYYAAGGVTNFGIGIINNEGSAVDYNLTLNFTDIALWDAATVNPSSIASLGASASEDVDVTLDTAGLEVGETYDSLLIISDGSEDFATVPLRLTVASNTCTSPNPSASLNCTNLTIVYDEDVYINVSANFTDSDITGCNITIGPNGTVIYDNVTMDACDFIIEEGGSVVFQNGGETLTLTGDFNVSGTATWNHETVQMDVSEDNEFGINVLAGGTLNITNGSVITNGDNESAGYYMNILGNFTLVDSDLSDVWDAGIRLQAGSQVHALGNVSFHDCGFTAISLYTTLALTGNLSADNTEVVVYMNDDAILDCDGYSIDGGDDVDSTGVEADDVVNITIRDCIITDFVYGIYLESSDNATVTNITVYHLSGPAIYLLNSNGVNVSHFSSNTTTYGAYLSGSNSNTFEDFNSTVTSSGFYATSSNYNTLASANFTYCVECIELLVSDYNNFTDVYASLANTAGVLIRDNSDDNRFVNLTAVENPIGLNISKSGSDDNLIANSTLCYNDEYDIDPAAIGTNQGINNTCDWVLNWADDEVDVGCANSCLPINYTFTKSVTSSTPVIGSEFNFTITVENSGTGLYYLNLTDAIDDPCMTFVDASPDNDSDEMYWDLGNLSPTGSVEVNITMLAVSDCEFNNTAFLNATAYNGSLLVNDSADVNISCFTEVDVGVCEVGASCTCLTNALNDPACDEVLMTEDIVSNSTTCVNDPENITNKTLDGQGHSITGNNTYGVSGVIADENQNITVENVVFIDLFAGVNFRYINESLVLNNTFDGCDLGVDFWVGYNNTAEENNFTWGDYGIRVYSGANNTVSNNTATWNLVSGIALDAGTTENLIENNTLYSNNYSGVIVEQSTSNTFWYNNASGNGYSGIVVSDESNGTVLLFNTANGNAQNGIILINSSFGVLVDDTALHNGEIGLYLYNSSYVAIVISNASSNGYHGIYLNMSDYAAITQNTANGNGDNSGIYLYDSYGVALITNTASNNSYYGILLIGSGNATLLENTVNENGQLGVLLELSDNATLLNTTADDNAFIGIALIESDDGTLVNNTATSNGGIGMVLAMSTGNNISDNNLTNNPMYSLIDVSWVGFVTSPSCNYIDNDSNMGGDGEPIRYERDSNNVTITNTDIYSEIMLCNVTNATLDNVTISNPIVGSDGLVMIRSNGASITDSVFEDVYMGVLLANSSNSTIGQNTVRDGILGMYLSSADNNDLLTNTVEDCDDGVVLYDSDSNYLYNNDITDSLYDGIYLEVDSNLNILTENTVCGSDDTDIVDDDANTGDDNTCQTTDGWDDTGTTDCTTLCVPEEEGDDGNHHNGGSGGRGGSSTGGIIIDPGQVLQGATPEQNLTPVTPLLPEPEKGLELRLSGALEEGLEFVLLVLDSDGNPVEGARVTYAGQTKTTGADAKVTFTAVSGANIAAAEKEGYTRATLQIIVAEAPQPVTGGSTTPVKASKGADWTWMIIAVVVIALLAICLLFIKKRKGR